MSVPVILPVSRSPAPARRIGLWERLRLVRRADRETAPSLRALIGERVRIEIPDPSSWYDGRLISVRRSQLCFEFVLGDAEPGGRLRILCDATPRAVVIRPITDAVVLHCAHYPSVDQRAAPDEL